MPTRSCNDKGNTLCIFNLVTVLECPPETQCGATLYIKQHYAQGTSANPDHAVWQNADKTISIGAGGCSVVPPASHPSLPASGLTCDWPI